MDGVLVFLLTTFVRVLDGERVGLLGVEACRFRLLDADGREATGNVGARATLVGGAMVETKGLRKGLVVEVKGLMVLVVDIDEDAVMVGCESAIVGEASGLVAEREGSRSIGVLGPSTE